MSTSQLVGPPPGVGNFPFRPGFSRGDVEDLHLFVDKVVVSPVKLIRHGSSLSSSGSADTPFYAVDANGQVLFDTLGLTPTIRSWSSEFDLYRWILGNESLSMLLRPGYDFGFEDEAQLDERAWSAAPLRITEIIVNGESTTSGPVIFESGFNLQAADTGDGQVTFNAGTGLGDGLDTECLPTPAPLRTLTRVGPDTYGNFNLRAQTGDCLTVTNPEEAQLMIRGDCGPCVTCDDFVRVYKAIKKIDDAGEEIGSRAMGIRDAYTAAVTRWNEEKACREARPLRITSSAYASGNTQCAVVMVTFCNSLQVCLVDLQLALNWTVSGETIVGEIVAGSTVLYPQGSAGIQYNLTGEWPDFGAGWGSVDPGKTVRLKFNICFPGVVSGDWAELEAIVTSAGLPEFADDTLRVTFT